MSDLPTDIDRINALTTNARNTWFALLGVLVFVGMTLMGVEHIDFYGVDRATKLPLVDVEVPTRYFFVAAPILTAAIYGYFHLYLIRLWDALSIADAQYEGRPLGDIITPWLVTDAALQLRRKLRDEHAPCNAHRTMETPAMLLNIALAWVFGLLILAMTWWLSMPARDLLLTGTAALSLLAALTVGLASYVMLTRRMLRRHRGPPNLHRSFGFSGFLVFIAVLILPLSWMRVTGVYDKNAHSIATIAPIFLVSEELVTRPDDWRSYGTARTEFRAQWCAREKLNPCTELSDGPKAFEQEWQEVRTTDLSDLSRPDWHKAGRRKPDFRQADLTDAFLAGVDLGYARMEQAVLTGAHLERANLLGARLHGATIHNAHLEYADFTNADLRFADFRAARLIGADFANAEMQNAEFRNANMQNANLEGAFLRDANLLAANFSSAGFEGADLQLATLTWAQLHRASLLFTDLSGAHLVGAKLDEIWVFETNLTGADLSYSYMSISNEDSSAFFDIIVDAAVNNGGALRYVDLNRFGYNDATDFRNVFLDGTVKLSPGFTAQMGAPLPKPCQWITTPLTDQEFFAIWRWWLNQDTHETNWKRIAPPIWHDVPLPTEEQLASHGLTNCEWKSGPMPGAGE